MQEQIFLVCSGCKRKNYITTKNKKKHPDKFEFSKYCRFCRKRTPHKEAKV
jgi:large subunit ribosomal protein L33